MAGKITEMAAATTLAGTELVEVVQSGTNKKATIAQILAGAQPLFGAQVANVVFAGPASGGAAAATFRPLVTADIPDLSSVYAGAVHGHAIGEVSGLGTAAARNVGTSSTNLVEVQSDGKILGSLLPALAISETFPVASQAAMLALTAQRGDVAIRTDENKSYILSTDSPGTLADWKELLSPTDGVFSFNTRAGAVTLLAGDVTSALGLTPFANPMTTPGDLITGGTAGAATRLAMGSALQVLRVNAGATALEFAAPSASGGYDKLTQSGANNGTLTLYDDTAVTGVSKLAVSPGAGQATTPLITANVAQTADPLGLFVEQAVPTAPSTENNYYILKSTGHSQTAGSVNKSWTWSIRDETYGGLDERRILDFFFQGTGGPTSWLSAAATNGAYVTELTLGGAQVLPANGATLLGSDSGTGTRRWKSLWLNDADGGVKFGVSGTAVDVGLNRASAGVLKVTDGSSGYGGLQALAVSANTANGAGLNIRTISESITLNTGGTTTDSSANLLPANSFILGVTARITTGIGTATDWKLGDGTTAGRFTAANSTLTAGTTDTGLLHLQGSVSTDAAGPIQVAAAKLRITTTGTPSAGVIRVTVTYIDFTAPTS